MDTLYDHIPGVAALLAAGAFTPGPNNAIVVRRAAAAGVRGALPAIGGVVAGSLALLAVVALGGGALFQALPALRAAIAVAGAVALAALGARLVARRRADGGDAPPAGAGFTALAALQVANPKSWLMVVTAVASLPAADPGVALALLAPLFVVIPVGGLLAWGVAGARLLRRVAPARLDAATGVLLVASAALLAVEAIAC